MDNKLRIAHTTQGGTLPMGNGLDNLHGNSGSRTCNYSDRLSLLDVCDNSIKTISAVSSGLLEGTATKLCQYSSHIMDQPLVELWHGAESAAIGFGLASINKRLAWAFGALASGEMIYRGLAATNDSLPTIMNLAATGKGYEETKQVVASKFGQLSADLIAMSATGAISGGCVVAARRGKIAWKEMKIVQQERAAGHYDSVFERMSMSDLKKQIKNDASINAIPKQEALGKLMIKFSDPWNYTTNTGEHLYMSNSAQVSMIRSLSKLSGEVNANDSVRHAENLLRLAHVHELNLEYKAEIKVLERARAILDKKVKEVPDRLELPHGGDMYLFNLDQLTRAYVRIKRYPKAIESAQKTVAYCKSVSGQNSSSYIWSNNDLARTYYDAGKQDLALQTFQKALKSAETADNADELKKVIAREDHLISQLYHHYSRDRKMVNQVMDLIKACGIKHIHGEWY